jgi:hypothetical protein
MKIVNLMYILNFEYAVSLTARPAPTNKGYSML